MNDMSSMNRERENKKKQLRQQIVFHSAGGTRGDDSEEIIRSARRRGRHRRLTLLFIAAIFLLITGFAAYQYLYNRQFREYQVTWEIPVNESSFVRYEKFGTNVLKYSKDGVSYIDHEGKTIWVESFEMKWPVTAVNGDYAAIADQQGNKIYICDKSGKKSVATTLLPIIRVTVSAHGVVAAILEDTKANYIQFYKNDGTQLNIAIKGTIQGAMDKSGTDPVGYPMDISLSPDGTQLIGSYMYMNGGSMKCRVAFHNFSEIGKNGANRLVAGFHDEFASSVVPRVRFLTEIYSVAFADDKIVFFSSNNLASPGPIKNIPVEEEIRSILYSNQYAGIVVSSNKEGETYRMDIYKENGDLAFSKAFDYPYIRADIDGDNIILYNENSCRVYNMSGIERFAGEFDFTLSQVTLGRFPNTLILTGPDTMKEIKFK